MSEDQNKIIRASRKIGSSHSAGEGVEPCGAEHPVAGVNEVKDRAEQVQVVAGDPPAKVAAAAVLNHPGVKLKTTLPPVVGRAVAVVNARVKVPVVVAPGTRSAATEAAAVPLPLALPPAVIAGTEPEPAVSMTTPVAVAVATL